MLKKGLLNEFIREEVINMYNLHKIIIMGNFRPDDQQGLETVVMETYGMKILRVLYINDINSLKDKGSIRIWKRS